MSQEGNGLSVTVLDGLLSPSERGNDSTLVVCRYLDARGKEGVTMKL